MKVLVTGGSGFIGNALARALIGQGHEVHALGRSSELPAEKTFAGLHYHRLDLTKDSPANSWFDGVEAVFHTAAKAGVGGNFEEYRLANLVATRRLLDHCRGSGVSLFIHTSTPSVTFSTDPIRGGDESLSYSTEKFSAYATTKALAEQEVLRANDASGMRTIALRPHLVWGDGDPHLLPRVVSRHRAGRLRIVGDGTNQVDLTHLDNVTHAHLQALRAMLANPALGGKPYFIGQNEPVSLWPWLNEIFVAIGLPRVETRVSFRAAWRIGWTMETAWSILRRRDDPPMTRFIACQLAHDHWFSGANARIDLGYEPILDMQRALEKTLPWLRKL